MSPCVMWMCVVLATRGPRASLLHGGLWGRLRDFEQEGILNRSLDTLLSEMTEGMQADVRRLAPIVIDWLQEVSDGTKE